MGFQAGYDKSAAFFPDGGSPSAANTLNITGHSWQEAVDKLDVTHSGTAGFQALLAGILRGEGNVKANLDNAAMPWATVPSLVAGTNGVIHFKVALSDYTVPCMVMKVHFQSAVEGKVEYDFDVALNVLAGSGAASISRPAS